MKRKTIHPSWIDAAESKWACAEAIDWLRGKPRTVNELIAHHLDWAEWCASRLLPAAAWAEYDKVRAAAWAEYDKVSAAAWAEYNKVRTPALAEYNKVRAAALAERLAVTTGKHDEAKS